MLMMMTAMIVINNESNNTQQFNKVQSDCRSIHSSSAPNHYNGTHNSLRYYTSTARNGPAEAAAFLQTTSQEDRNTVRTKFQSAVSA